MTATTVTAVEWGVRWSGSTDRTTHVDVRQDEADARRWHHAVEFSGSGDAEVVTRTGRGPWRAVPAGMGEVPRG